MNDAEAQAAAEALHAALERIRSKRANWLVIADHDPLLTKLVEVGETVGAVIARANALATECFSDDATLVARLSGSLEGVHARTAGATGQLLEARKVVRREVLEHRDDPPPRGSRRSPWATTAWGGYVVAPLDGATAAAWALTRPRAEGDAADLTDHYWLAAGLAHMAAKLWHICDAEEPKLTAAYTGVATVRSGQRAQESVTQAAGQWQKAGAALVATMAILRKRARDQGAALERPQALVAAGGAA